jgi:putative flavoprotein involved in K+ transport
MYLGTISQYDVIVIGGGQAGLAMGYHLARRGLSFLIIDAADAPGAAWRNRWDSLTLFTPAKYSALPGLRFPAEPGHMPTRLEVADYLALYESTFSLPVRRSERVVALRHVSEWAGFVVETTQNTYCADQVVVATGPFHKPLVPALSQTIAAGVTQLHSSEYRSPKQLPAGDVLVVGGGNSGVQIATEVARSRRTFLSISKRLPTLPQQLLGHNLFWWLDTLGAMSVSATSTLGRRASRRDFLIGKSPEGSARDDGVRLLGRTQAAEGTLIFTSDGAAVEPSTIIWATGFTQDFNFIDVPVFDGAGRPIHRRGVTGVNGLYFLGLPWQHTRGSALLGWVGRDAEFLAGRIAN